MDSDEVPLSQVSEDTMCHDPNQYGSHTVWPMFVLVNENKVKVKSSVFHRLGSHFYHFRCSTRGYWSWQLEALSRVGVLIDGGEKLNLNLSDSKSLFISLSESRKAAFVS